MLTDNNPTWGVVDRPGTLTAAPERRRSEARCRGSHPGPVEVPAGPPRRTHSGPSVAAAAFAVLVGAVAAALGLIVPSHFTLRGVVGGGLVGAVFFVGGLLAVVEWADEEVDR